jgi:acyl carrier protein
MITNQDNSFERVRNVVARTFKVSPEIVTQEASLGQLPGWDSFGHLTLMMEVEQEFSVRFPTDAINRPKNVREICDLLR